MYNYMWTLAYVTILNSFYVIIAFIIWYHLWVKKLGGIHFLLLMLINS